MDTIIAVRVCVDSGADRYFLTWGRVGSNNPWPGDIEHAVFEAAKRWSTGGVPISATICDSLQAAAGERYFYERLTSMHHMMPPIGDEFWPWADGVCGAVLEGEELYYCGLPKEEQDRSIDPDSKFGFTLDCFDKHGDLVSETELLGLTAERVQEILGDPDIDRVMCLTHEVAGEELKQVLAGADVATDEETFDYFVSPWADGGFRTPHGYFPPPRTLKGFPSAEKVRPARESPSESVGEAE